MDADEHRSEMVDRLVTATTVRTATVEAALREVPRHVFVDHVSAQTAYADVAVPVREDAEGTTISSASQPTLVAEMLEMLALEPGQRVLEIGTGTGYNAALIAFVVGSEGAVVTVELEADLATRAQTLLEAFGLHGVEVINGDGAIGHLRRGPYDRWW